MPQAGWGAKYKGSDMVYDGTGNSGQPNHYSVSGSEPDQVLTFNIPGTLVANDSGSITFQVQLKAPDGTTGSNSRFQNTFVISYNNGSGQTATPVRRTPFVQFSLSNPVPDINEIR